MSSKKARRRKGHEQDQDGSGKRLSPVALFFLIIGLAMLVTVVGALVFRDRSDRGAPPWPGAVWSGAHEHWH
jgi:hypothetical protein